MNKSKTNSRFSVLIEDDNKLTSKNQKNATNKETSIKLNDKTKNIEESEKKFNVFTSDDISGYDKSGYDISGYSRNKNRNKEPEIVNKKSEEEIKQAKEQLKILEENKKREIIQKQFSDLNFPELNVDNKINNRIINALSNDGKNMWKKFEFKNENNLNETPKMTSEKQQLEKGWCKLYYDKNSRKTIIENYSESANEVSVTNNLVILSNIIEYNEKRKNTHIKLWGQHEWDNMFSMVNYDNEYFDKLDEIYKFNSYEENDDFNGN